MQIIFPDWYDDLYEFECEAKGCLLNLIITVYNQKYQINSYDSAHFAQEYQKEIKMNGYFQDPQVVILEKVNKATIQDYFQKIIML